jgi:L-fucose isomerase
MGMAQAAAKFLTENLHHPNGLPVECVIADTCIGGVAEAAECSDKFAREGAGVSLTVTPCWCYGSETMDMDPLVPKAVWGFNGTERPGAVHLAAVLAARTRRACRPSASTAATCRRSWPLRPGTWPTRAASAAAAARRSS